MHDPIVAATLARSVPPSASHLPISPSRVAVVLNGNARAVCSSLIRNLGQVLGGESVFMSRSPEQSQFIARTIVNRGFEVVLCGGGDGTFCQCVTDVLALRPARPVAFGILRLGTGNALASSLDAAIPTVEGLASDLRLATAPEAQADLALLRVDGRLAPFAGFGLDALILEDYNTVRGTLAKTPLHGLGQGSMGYALAIGCRSLWRYALEDPPQVTIRNTGATTQRIDLQGRPVGKPISRGAIIYSGPVAIAAASTIANYGLGLRLFPQVESQTGRFQLRVGQVGALSLLSRLPALFRGELEDEGLCDYLCTAISVELEKPRSLQVGGDEVGRRESASISLTHVRAVGRRFLPPGTMGSRVPAFRLQAHSGPRLS